MQTCPFCGGAETDRIDVEGQRFLVFPCMFTPSVDPKMPEEELAVHLREEYGSRGPQYFRSMCDRLHLVVVREPDPAASPAGAPGEPGSI